MNSPTFRPSPKLPPTGDIEIDVVNAHAHSIDHRDLLSQSEKCGCFYCQSIFAPDAISEWTDQVEGRGVTALCPRCGIDSVIGSASGFPIDRVFLERMRQHWMT